MRCIKFHLIPFCTNRKYIFSIECHYVGFNYGKCTISVYSFKWGAHFFDISSLSHAPFLFNSSASVQTLSITLNMKCVDSRHLLNIKDKISFHINSISIQCIVAFLFYVAHKSVYALSILFVIAESETSETHLVSFSLLYSDSSTIHCIDPIKQALHIWWHRIPFDIKTMSNQHIVIRIRYTSNSISVIGISDFCRCSLFFMLFPHSSALLLLIFFAHVCNFISATKFFVAYRCLFRF